MQSLTRTIWLIALLSISYIHGYTTEKEIKTDNNSILLSGNWLIYKDNKPELIPLLNTGQDIQIAFQWIDVWKYRKNFLCFQGDKDLVLFVNNKFYSKFDESQNHSILLNDLIKTINLHFDKKPVLFCFWNKNRELPLNSIYIQFSNETTIPPIIKQSTFLPVLSSVNTFNYYIIIILLFNFFIIALFKLLFPDLLYRSLSLLKGMPSKNIFIKDQENLFNPYSILSTISLILGIGFTLYLGIIRSSISIQYLRNQNNIWVLVGYLTFIILLPFLVKYLLNSVLSFFYKIQKFTKTYYLYSINLNFLGGYVLTFFLILYLIFPIIYFDKIYKIELLLFLVFWSVKFFYLFFVLINKYKPQKFHLFIYLCALDWVPVLFIFKILGIQLSY